MLPARGRGSNSRLFSTKAQMERLRDIVCLYSRLPFSTDAIPGGVLEGALATVRDGRRLGKYDFVDVVRSEDRVAWQVKSTAEDTPVTWKRAKIGDRNGLIRACDEAKDEEERAEAVAFLGNEVIDFCNKAVERDFDKHPIDEIGYARLVVFGDGRGLYFERRLVTRDAPVLFRREDFSWEWSKERTGGKKEQLSALHGTHRPTGRRWWAWHGRGENQLHFTGERAWWPSQGDGEANAIAFRFPTRRFSLDELASLLDAAAEGSD